MTKELVTSNKEEFSELERTVHSAGIDIAIQEKEENYFNRITNSIKEKLDCYFRPKSFELWGDGKIYEYVGVKYFKKILPTGGDYVARWINYRPIANASSKEKGLKDYEKSTRIYESIHIPLVILMFYYLIDPLTQKEYDPVLLNIGLNLTINIYPIMVQRYNRARIYNALDKIEYNKKLSTKE